MKRTLTWQLGIIIIGMILASLCITSIAMYKTAYDKIYEAAGIEAYGCANITTGLLQPKDIDSMLQGNKETAARVGNMLNWTTDHKAIFETQYIVDLNGNILALDNHLKDKGFNIGDAFHMDTNAIAMLKEMRHPTYSEIYEYGGMKRLSGYAPIFKDHDPTKDIVAISVIDFNADILTERTWAVVKDGLLLGSIPIVLASFLTVLLIRRKTKPISALISHAKRIADGHLDIADTEANSKDEIGDLAQALNMMTHNLRSMIATLKQTSDHLTHNAEQTSASLAEMNTALHQVSRSIGEVAADTSGSTEGAANAADALVNLAQLIQAAKEKTNDSAQNSQRTLAAAHQGQTRLNEITERMNTIKSATMDTEHTIKELNMYTNEIQTITETITGIAAQTNLLALNASIEAARAGEHGKGFAVVAEEVRKLAEQSNREVAEVEKLVQKITDSISKTVGSIQESRLSVNEGEQTVLATHAALEQILRAVQNTVEEIQDISLLTNEEAATSEKIVALVHQLAASIENMAANSQEVSAAAEETTAFVEEVSHRSSKTAQAAQELNGIVNKFTL
ncbi:HAMP domain-containing protein [Aneurinibacillus sp. BA2021]|nr:HAMP domain-containing protein [Aneurinibacillus sp. BA2021]